MGLVTVRVVGTVETFENVRRICSSNTRAVVADAEMQLFFHQLCFNLDVGAGRGMADGVAEQDVEDLLDCL